MEMKKIEEMKKNRYPRSKFIMKLT